jgi:pimeloyl-ACP methyl ester carboxylesterase
MAFGFSGDGSNMVEIKKASHFPWMEQPRLIEEQLVRFYQNVE